MTSNKLLFLGVALGCHLSTAQRGWRTLLSPPGNEGPQVILTNQNELSQSTFHISNCQTLRILKPLNPQVLETSTTHAGLPKVIRAPIALPNQSYTESPKGRTSQTLLLAKSALQSCAAQYGANQLWSPTTSRVPWLWLLPDHRPAHCFP
jgi:hypothetical protein